MFCAFYILMHQVSVVISNWPEFNLSDVAALFVAVVALGISLYSAYLSRKSNILASRPYVRAASYAVIENGKPIPQPDKLAYRVHNRPARIIKESIRVLYEGEMIFEHCKNNSVRFPDDRSESSFIFGGDIFSGFMSRPDLSKLERRIDIVFAAIDGGGRYQYLLRQKFNQHEGQWRDIEESTT